MVPRQPVKHRVTNPSRPNLSDLPSPFCRAHGQTFPAQSRLKAPPSEPALLAALVEVKGTDAVGLGEPATGHNIEHVGSWNPARPRSDELLHTITALAA